MSSSHQTPERFEDLPVLRELREHLVAHIASAERSERHVMRRRRPKTRRLLGALAVLVIGGTAGAAVLATRESRPLSGTLPAEFAHVVGARHYSLSLFPLMSVGWTGWCSSATFTIHARPVRSSYSCRPVQRPDASEVSAYGGGNPYGYFLYTIVTDRVTEVRYSGSVRVKPIANRRLPSWARAAVWALSRKEASRLESSGRGGQLLNHELFDANGSALTERGMFRSEAAEHLPLTTLNPDKPADLPCAIHASSIAGLVPVSQTVSTPVAWPRRAPGGFLACANAVYRLHGTNLAAAVLLNALNPARRAEQLPGLSPDPSHPGVFLGGEVGTIGYPESIGGGGPGGAFGGHEILHRHSDVEKRAPEKTRAGRTMKEALEELRRRQGDLGEERNSRDHDISATRLGRGWLVAEGGTPAQRATLLHALSTEA